MNTKNDLNYRLYLQKESGFERTPFSNEFERYKDIQQGDIEKVKKNFQTVRENFHAGKGTLSNDPVRNIRYHMIISTAITARICVEGGMPHDEAYTLSDIYIQKADTTNSFDALLDLFGAMQVDFATHMHESKKRKAISIHIRKCIDYIHDHLHEKITINDLAAYVGRNASYLSKLFSKEMQTTLHCFIQNARISVAKNMLQYSNVGYTDIAMALGFSSQSAFISVFHAQTGMTPKQFRDSYYNVDVI